RRASMRSHPPPHTGAIFPKFEGALVTLLDSASSSRPPPRQQPVGDAKTAFLARAVDDWGSLISAALVIIGDKLGLYAALADGGPATPADLARRTGTVKGYIRP